MARLARLIIPMQAHHILLMGNEGVPLLKDHADFERMFNFIYEQAVREDVLVHAYTLLGSQVHLLVTPKSQDSLSRMMQGLGRSYVRYFNLRYEREGTLWAGRYKSSVVQAGEWIKKTLVYMDHLPMRRITSKGKEESKALETAKARGEIADQMAALGDYEWSSYLHYTGKRNDMLITAHADVWNLGNTPFAREEAYEQLIQRGMSVGDFQHFEQSIKGGWILGDDTFIEHLQTQTHRRVAKAKPGRPLKPICAPTRGAQKA